MDKPTIPSLEQTKRRRGSGVATVYDTLKREILELRLRPGSPIDETNLTERFGMSRTPIREALIKLSGEGLVLALPNRSTIVAPIDLLDLPQFFDALTLMYRVTTRLAAANRTAADIVAIRDLQQGYAEAVAARDVSDMIEVNRDFHSAIALAGRNRYYCELFDRLLDEGRRLLRFYYSSFNDDLPPLFLDEHEEMVRAIEASDVPAADRIAKQHADQIVRQIQAYITADRRENGDITL
ncbi:GntR family transcriptional regulator [Pseudooceanicola sediminis]|uniref:GntR family transcriptional regulator n=1 Tax=Pseudooceanicola sediminis TaxID=2211117 RepID=A0A399J4N9_9RHOB|nr:GntR family transcriptional regulator [Pseudooceanicola sediminis]KAA2315490.1 GntR family transcriptional regulator [Puniceibacterium sp. HSS470]RII40304.1 GntR family transcriptional regulator [Pseudooceanicola sediminis]|tara:strand:- start:116718 stop:117434 length:717 start_codon:yes stop_codon:yes gene_type:complete